MRVELSVKHLRHNIKDKFVFVSLKKNRWVIKILVKWLCGSCKVYFLHGC